MTDRGDVAAFCFSALTTQALIARLTDEGLLESPLHVATASETGSSVLRTFSLPARAEARRMGQVYELLYCLENSVRELIESTLREKYPNGDDWWESGVPDPIRKAVAKRRTDDLKNRWHGPRGDSPLVYVDFPQYGPIIEHQWHLYEDLLGDKDWVISYFEEMNRTRRALAHNGRLTEADVERMEIRVKDWLRVVG